MTATPKSCMKEYTMKTATRSRKINIGKDNLKTLITVVTNTGKNGREGDGGLIKENGVTENAGLEFKRTLKEFNSTLKDDSDVSILSMTMTQNGESRLLGSSQDSKLDVTFGEDVLATSTQVSEGGKIDGKEREDDYCAACSRQITTNANSAQCDMCTKWTCTECNKITEDDLGIIAKSADVKGCYWVCGMCVNKVDQLLCENKKEQGEMKMLQIKYTNLLENNNIYKTTIRDQELELKKKDGLIRENSKRIDEIQKECKDYKERLEIALGELNEAKRTIGNMNETAESMKELNKIAIGFLKDEKHDSQSIYTDISELMETVGADGGEVEKNNWENKENETTEKDKENKEEGDSIEEEREEEKMKSENKDSPNQNKKVIVKQQNQRKDGVDGRTIKHSRYVAKIECRNFKVGRCQWGKDCKFLHKYTHRTSHSIRIECLDYKAGRCQWGAECKFLHRSKYPNRGMKPRVEENKIEVRDICWNYQEGRPCPFNKTREGCRYKCYRNIKKGFNNNSSKGEMCWYYQEKQRCPHGGSEGKCRYRCYSDYEHKKKDGTMSFDIDAHPVKEDTALQNTRNEERVKVEKKVNFLESQIENLRQSLNWAQRVQMGMNHRAMGPMGFYM